MFDIMGENIHSTLIEGGENVINPTWVSAMR